MPFSTRQKLVMYVGDDQTVKAGWVTVTTIETMIAEGYLVPADLTDDQVATAIHALSARLAGNAS